MLQNEIILQYQKRIIDMILFLIVLVVTLPISIITSVLIKLESDGPIIYKQERVGRDGKVFSLYKFRSMRQDAEKESGPIWAKENDPRVTRVGRIIRILRIDEIPQIFNVLKGDMSFIGPRPERPHFVNILSSLIPQYKERHSLKPGITGLAAVKYKYGSSIEDSIEKFRYDLYYLENLSLLLDMVIIFKTIIVVFTGKGAR